jgi:aspartate/methionine/tyrosine aminotransferase
MAMAPSPTHAETIERIAAQVASTYSEAAAVDGPGVDLTRGEVRLDCADLIGGAGMSNVRLRYQSPRGDAALGEAYLGAVRQAGITARLPASESILVCAGGKQAMYLALQSLVRPGTRILLPQPGWAPYAIWARSLGARPVFYDASDPGGRDLLTRLRSDGADAVVVNTPNNPCGAELTVSAIEAIAQEAGACDAVIVSDEVYRHFAADRSASFLPHVGAGVARVAVIDSISKWLAAAGLRIGFLIADRRCLELAVTLRGLIDSCPAGPSQALATHLMTASDARIEHRVRRFVRARLDAFQAMLEGEGVAIAGRGGLYIWVQAPACGLHLARRGRLALRGVCGSVFGQPGFVRFCPTGVSPEDAAALGLAEAEPEAAL